MVDRIPVFYDLRQVSRVAEFPPSPHKPALVVADWLSRGQPIRVEAPAPVSRDQLALAHDRAFVDGVLDLAIGNGFHNRDPRVAASLPWTSGSLRGRRAVGGPRVLDRVPAEPGEGPPRPMLTTPLDPP